MSSKVLQIDPDSPVPLYHQIAEAIRGRIEGGELSPGAALEPLRQAAETWNVNLHTVRHAYAALVRSGLVESRRGPGGTRVLGRSAAPSKDLRTYAGRVAEEAARLYGAGTADLARALGELEASGRDQERLPRVWVVECSDWQCESHARELRGRFRIDAQPWNLTAGEPPEGVVVSNYFHYNDVRRLWPRRLGTVQFCSIHPDPALAGHLGTTKRVIVAERDASTVEAVTADLVALLGERKIVIEPRITEDPSSCLGGEDTVPVLFTPRVWADLDERSRQNPRALELRYVFDESDLQTLGATLHWKPKRGAVA